MATQQYAPTHQAFPWQPQITLATDYVYKQLYNFCIAMINNYIIFRD